MTAHASQPTPAELKGCCAALYESDWATLLLGESFHPGGLKLTERLGTLLRIGPESHVLDVASGRGTSAIHLARVFGCRVSGVELSQANVEQAQGVARRAGVAERVMFTTGDAEALPFPDARFDAVICECALCTFPDMETAVGEFVRMLRPRGRVGISDVTRSGALPSELDGALSVAACIAGARPANAYAELFRAAGLTDVSIERHDGAMLELTQSVQVKLLGARLLSHTGQIALPAGSIERGRALVKTAADAVTGGVLGYAVITASKLE